MVELDRFFPPKQNLCRLQPSVMHRRTLGTHNQGLTEEIPPPWSHEVIAEFKVEATGNSLVQEACDRRQLDLRGTGEGMVRHYAATVLFIKGIPDAITSKMTGHRSRELKRYHHLSPLFRQQTVELCSGLGGKASDTISGTAAISASPQ
jgi:hypothetical protein